MSGNQASISEWKRTTLAKRRCVVDVVKKKS
jgi:hypothetical protein